MSDNIFTQSVQKSEPKKVTDNFDKNENWRKNHSRTDCNSDIEALELKLLCDSFFEKTKNLIDNCALAMQCMQL